MTGLGLCRILDVNSEDRGEPLPTSERWNKWARSVQSRLGVREEESPVWSSVGGGMACCSATREGGGFLGLHGTPLETSGFAHSRSLPQVVEIVKRLESRQRGWEEEDPERKGAIVFNATSEFCRTLGEIPTYGLAGNREDQEELMVGPRAAHSRTLPGPALLLGAGDGGSASPQGQASVLKGDGLAGAWTEPGHPSSRTLNGTRSARPVAALSPTGRRTWAGAPSTWTRRSSSKM